MYLGRKKSYKECSGAVYVSMGGGRVGQGLWNRSVTVCDHVSRRVGYKEECRRWYM
jgi:hypothetical protein